MVCSRVRIPVVTISVCCDHSMAGAALSIPRTGRGQEDVCEKVCAKVRCVWSRRPRSHRLEGKSGTGPAGTTGKVTTMIQQRTSPQVNPSEEMIRIGTLEIRFLVTGADSN